MRTGVFVGLITLDCIYQTRQPLQPNEKQVAEQVLLAAGGPATNAAIAFSALGGRARLVGSLGQHPLAAIVRDDLARHGVELVDLLSATSAPPPFSSIVVNVATGDRAVISRNAVDRPLPPQLPTISTVLANADGLLIDGHQMRLGEILAQQARKRQLPIVVDAGSWKSGFERVLPLATAAIASANFAPPGTGTEQAAIAYLRHLQIPCTAVTRGDQPLLYATPTQVGELPVPSIQPVDTLGAGDIFHGAFCKTFDSTSNFLAALAAAAPIAAMACQSFGTRQWISQLDIVKTEVRPS